MHAVELVTNTPNIQKKDLLAKQKMKEHADKRARAQTYELAIGDLVLVRQKKRNKFTTRFDPAPYQVVRIQGTMITAVRNEKYLTRNVSQFKWIDSSLQGPEDESDVSDDEAVDGNDHQDPHQDGNDRQDPHPVPPDGPAAGARPVEIVPARRYPSREKNTFSRYGQNVYDLSIPSTFTWKKGRDVMLSYFHVIVIVHHYIIHHYIIDYYVMIMKGSVLPRHFML